MSVDCYIRQLLKNVNTKSEKILVIVIRISDFTDFTDSTDKVNRADRFSKVTMSHT